MEVRLNEPTLAPRQTVPDSQVTFPDGRRWRLEIPSVEGPAALAAVFDEAQRRGVEIDRVSQGSGIALLLDSEIEEMVRETAARGVELVLFVGPRGAWDIGAAVLSSGGAAGQAAVRNRRQLEEALADVERAAALGVGGVLVADYGLLCLIAQRRHEGRLPSGFVLKYSVLGGPCNPASAAVLEALGADSINLNSDHSLSELSEFRHEIKAAIDLYIEAPDNVGGFIRYHEIAEFVRVASPVYLKFGLRNAPGIYPAGAHLQAQVESSARERVRRAQIGLEHLNRALEEES